MEGEMWAQTCKADAVILGTTLGDGHDHGLMVGSGCHGAETIITGREAAGDVGGEKTLSIPGVVDTLEEGKLGRIERRGRVKRIA